MSSQYLNGPVLLFYYQQINRVGSRESDVDNFYLNFLHQIFLLGDNFGTELESRPAKELGLSQATDFRIRYVVRLIKNSIHKRVILFENKRRDLEGQDAVWEDALKQVVDCANLIRTEESHDPSQILYLGVNIGTHLRLYELPGHSEQAIDWKPAGGRIFELADDEVEVENLFQQLRTWALLE